MFLLSQECLKRRVAIEQRKLSKEQTKSGRRVIDLKTRHIGRMLNSPRRTSAILIKCGQRNSQIDAHAAVEVLKMYTKLSQGQDAGGQVGVKTTFW